MKIAKISILVSSIYLTGFVSIKPEPVITTYLQHPPFTLIKSVEKTLQQEKMEKINNIGKKSPSQISKKFLQSRLNNSIIPALDGFLTTYYGYLDYSNKDGRIAFPLRHSPANKVNLLISPQIKLVKVAKNTVGYADFEGKEDNMVFYSYEQKRDKNNALYWNVQKKTLPKNKRIDPLTITILTKAKNIFVEEGDFQTEENSNLILPNNIYVIGNKSNVKILLGALDFARYFEPIEMEMKKTSDTVDQTIINN